MDKGNILGILRLALTPAFAWARAALRVTSPKGLRLNRIIFACGNQTDPLPKGNTEIGDRSETSENRDLNRWIEVDG